MRKTEPKPMTRTQWIVLLLFIGALTITLAILARSPATAQSPSPDVAEIPLADSSQDRTFRAARDVALWVLCHERPDRDVCERDQWVRIEADVRLLLDTVEKHHDDLPELARVALVATVSNESGFTAHPTRCGKDPKLCNDAGTAAGFYQLSLKRPDGTGGEHLAACQRDGLDVDPHDLESSTRCYVVRWKASHDRHTPSACGKLPSLRRWGVSLHRIGKGPFEPGGTKLVEQCLPAAVGPDVCEQVEVAAMQQRCSVSRYWRWAAVFWKQHAVPPVINAVQR